MPDLDDWPIQEAVIAMVIAAIFGVGIGFLYFVSAMFCGDCPQFGQLNLSIPTALFTLSTLAGGFLVIFKQAWGLYILVIGLAWDEIMAGLTFVGGWYDVAPITLFFVATVGYFLFRFIETIHAKRIYQMNS